MRITCIEIENFKCVGKRQVVEIRPITLLFGPNSSGKSTILHALHYLREILERNNADPDFTIGGGQLDLGGFKAFVNDHDLKKTITLKVTMEFKKDEKNRFFPLNSGSKLDSKEFEALQVNYLTGQMEESDIELEIKEVGVEIEIAWDADRNVPCITKLTSFINGLSIASIISTSNNFSELRDMNFDHPLLQPIDKSRHSPIDIEISKLTPRLQNDQFTRVNQPQNEMQRIQLNQIGALPPLDDDLNLILFEWDEAHNIEFGDSERIRGMKKLFTDLILGPVRIVHRCLEKSIFVGPIREIPERNYKPKQIVENYQWANGKGAWDMLYNDINGDLIKSVNDWISGEERLATPYQIERINFKDFPSPQKEDSESVEDGVNNPTDTIQKYYNKLVLEREIVIKHAEKRIILKPDDVGIGISQMLPIVVSVLSKNWNLLAIEQPELHIHPALQVRLGDLFIHSTESATVEPSETQQNEKSLIIETHSEQILLRILRRMRETSDMNLPDHAVELTPEKLSIVLVENTEAGVTYTPLDVTKKGEFFEQWPNGFFDERLEEIF